MNRRRLIKNMKPYSVKIRWLLLMATLIFVIAFAGCENPNKKVTNYNVKQLEEAMTGVINNIVYHSSDEMLPMVDELDVEDIEAAFKANKYPTTANAFLDGVHGYVKVKEEAGEFVEIKDIHFELLDNEAKGTAVCAFANREVKVNAVFNNKSIIQTISFSPEYSLGEIAEKAGMNTLIGMGTVFIILIFIAFIISLLKFVNPEVRNKSKKKEATSTSEVVDTTSVAAANEVDLTDDLELVAVITAAIAQYEGATSTDGFVVRQIIRRDTNNW